MRQSILQTLFVKNESVSKLQEYVEYVLHQQLNKEDYIPIAENAYAGKSPKKLIAYYLPQYYQIPQNDAWYGRGFTEWTNCSKAVPQFTGHWQPHLPIDVGFYNLDTTKIMSRQVELAKMYGIHGFCFYYYWFSGGEKIMEKPIINWLNDKELNFPFMFFWANEDWTNNWGQEADIGTKTYSAMMKPSDVIKFVNDILPFLKDQRYIKVNDRPHLIIYQVKKDPYLPEFIRRIGDLIEKGGVERPYISLVFPDDLDQQFDPRNFGADAAVEFGSHLRTMPTYKSVIEINRKLMNPLARLTEYDMDTFISNEQFQCQTDFPVFKGAMTHFDNTARSIYVNAHLFDISPNLYQKWLSDLIATAETDQIFLSAWNEWAEGMHLEPDQRFGYAYLQATKNALDENR